MSHARSTPAERAKARADGKAALDKFNAGLQEVSNSLTAQMEPLRKVFENVSKSIADVSKGLTPTMEIIRRMKLEEQLGEGTMTDDSILVRRLDMAVKARTLNAKKKTVTPPRTPKFKCPDHRVALIFSKLNQVWECPEPGCTKSMLPQMSRTDTTVIKGEPRIVGKMDADGDVQWYLNYVDENVMIELPFRTTAFEGAANGALRLLYATDNFVIFNKRGDKVSLDEINTM